MVKCARFVKKTLELNDNMKKLNLGTKLVAIRDFGHYHIEKGDTGTIYEVSSNGEYKVAFENDNWYITEDLKFAGSFSDGKVHFEVVSEPTRTIEIPDGYEIDEELTVIKFKKIKDKIPNTWEELNNIVGCYVDSNSKINSAACSPSDEVKNVFFTKKQAESSLDVAMYSQLKEKNDSYDVLCVYLEKMKPILEIGLGENVDAYIALRKLDYLKKEVNEDWIPDYKDQSRKFIIRFTKNEIESDWFCNTQYFLSFPEQYIRDAFLDNHKALIQQAKSLL